MQESVSRVSRYAGVRIEGLSMGEFTGTLLERIRRTPTVESFRFSVRGKPSFLPGQFVTVIFDENNRKNRELNKYLSFSSSPARDYIEVTKRLSGSEFSQRLQRLSPGDEVLFQGPLGNCVFRDEYAKIGFLIGGIGITPVISIIEYIMEKKLPTDVILVYSNRNHEEIAFKQELDAWQKKAAAVKVVYTLTDCAAQDDVCVYGRIDKTLVLEKISDIRKRRFFIYGPPAMVDAMKTVCFSIGCDKELVSAENFTGY